MTKPQSRSIKDVMNYYNTICDELEYLRARHLPAIEYDEVRTHLMDQKRKLACERNELRRRAKRNGYAPLLIGVAEAR